MMMEEEEEELMAAGAARSSGNLVVEAITMPVEVRGIFQSSRAKEGQRWG